jgi:hypothetical protein
VVVDLDGTLSDAATRQHYLDRRPKDWAGFFRACGDDPVLSGAARLMACLDPALRVIVLTARPVWVQEATIAWLERFELPWDLLLMREDGDYRASPDAKRDAVRALLGIGFDLRLAIDDDARNVAMFEAEGVPCLHVAGGIDTP